MINNSLLKRCKKPLIGVLAAFLSIGSAQAEGTKELSPANNRISALTLIPSRFSGSYLEAPVANRVRFYISSPQESIYSGFKWMEYLGSGTPNNITMYYKLWNPNGVLVKGGALNTSGTGTIQSYDEAVAGPRGVGGANTNGYNPDITAISSFGANGIIGEYSIEFYRSTDLGATQAPATDWAISPYFDITITKRISTSSVTALPGRVFCRKWGLVAVNGTSLIVTASASAAPTFYSYSDDQTIVKVAFNDVFKPIAYDMAVNFYGVKKTGADGDFEDDRSSLNSVSSPNIPDGYRLFVNSPERAYYPIKSITVQPALANPPITGCGTNMKINFNMPAAGDARILLDLNGIDGYQEFTADRILEVFNAPAGYGSVDWDGRNGLKVIVQNTAIIKISAVYERGRFNLPLYDAEINKNGFDVEAVAPIASTTTPLYWDDSSKLVNVTGNTADPNQNNSTGRGRLNSLAGTPSPAHAWNGDGNLTQRIPALSINGSETNSSQDDDFGNVRVINTWGWALQASSPVTQISFGCYSLSGNVFHDANGLKDGFVNQTGTVTSLPSTLYANVIAKDVYTDNDNIIHTTETVIAVAQVSANGSYTIAAVPKGSYTVVLSKTAGIVGDTINVPVASLPTDNVNGNWVNTGENLAASTVTGNDNSVDGRLAVTINASNVINANFAIEQLPVSTGVTAAQQGNPGGTNKVIVPTLIGKDVEDDNYAATDTILINSLPTNGTLYYAGTPVTLGQTIFNYVPANLTVDPIDGDQTITFTYSNVDAAGRQSTTPASVSMPFKVYTVDGSIWDDANGNRILEGNEVLISGNNNTSGGSAVTGTSLYANLLNAAGNVIQTVQVGANGAYSLNLVPYSTANLTIQVSTVQGVFDQSQAAITIPANWVTTGESVNGNGATQTNIADGIINLPSLTGNLSNQNFGMEKRPESANKTVIDISNPGGTNKVQVPTLTGIDLEDGTYNGATSTDTIIIKSIPASSDGILYYAGNAVTAGQTINNYDPLLLTIDPANGAVTAIFTYAHLDAAKKEDLTPATVSITFKVLTVSGNVWNDANGINGKDGSELLVSGNSTTNGTVSGEGNLYANLVDATSKIIQSVQVGADGTYSFTYVPVNATGLKIQLSKTNASEGATMPTTALNNNNWVNTAEVSTGNTATQTSIADGIINLTTLAANISGQNFGIEQLPFSDNITAASQGNPGGTNKIIVPTLTGHDPEEGIYNGTSNTNDLIIKTLPAIGKLYYDGTEITNTNYVITNYVPAKLTFDPADGNTNVTFIYVHTDAAGKQNVAPATVTLDFTVIAVSGNAWDDANGNSTNDNSEKLISGTNTSVSNSVASGFNLYANLLDPAGKVIQSVPLSSAGTYSLDKVPASTTGLKIQLSNTAGTVSAAPPVSTYPTSWVITGEYAGTGNLATQGTDAGMIDLATGTVSITNQNFGMERLPSALNGSVAKTSNPGGTVLVIVPASNFTGSDPEDGTNLSIVTGTQVQYTTFPTNITSITIGTTKYVASTTPPTGFTTWPATGVTVAINTAVSIDPMAGETTVQIPYKVIDLASKKSLLEATLNVPFGVSLVKLNLKVFLQGALLNANNTSSSDVYANPLAMRDDLRTRGYIPTNEPYSAMTAVNANGIKIFQQRGTGGGEQLGTLPTNVEGLSNTTATTVLAVTGDNAITDWVFVELRDATDNKKVIATRDALVQRDGDVVDMDGVTPLTFTSLEPASFYVVVHHRNHLGVMSAATIPMSSNVTVVDFTRTPAAGGNAVYGSNAQTIINATTGRIALWTGNARLDNIILYQGTANDVALVYDDAMNNPDNPEHAANRGKLGYNQGDLDMNGFTLYQGTLNDVRWIFFNITIHPDNPTKLANQGFMEQVPARTN